MAQISRHSISTSNNLLSRFVLTFLAIIIFCLSIPTKLLAVEVSIIDIPNEISTSEQKEATINLTCKQCKDSFIRVVFYKSGTNYFGYTQNNSGTLINTASNVQDLYKIPSFSEDQSTASAKISFKVDTSDSGYQGSGTYSIKVGRYTQSGSVTWSEPKQIEISSPISPTQLPLSTPTHTLVPSTKPSPITAPSKVSPSSTPTQLQVAIQSPTPKPTQEIQENKDNNSIMGINSENTTTPFTRAQKKYSEDLDNNPDNSFSSNISIVIGLLMITISVVLFLIPSRKLNQN